MVAELVRRFDLTPSWPGTAVRRTASLSLAYVPAIYDFTCYTKDVDARDKPGHDESVANAAK